MESRIAIIAGAGRFPFYVAQEARRQGLGVVAMGIRGWADPSLRDHVDTYEEVDVGALGRLIEQLKSRNVHQAVMAGKVTKEVLFNQGTRFDGEALVVLSRVSDYSVNTVLGAIAQRLADERITLLDSSTFLKANLCPSGVLTTRGPTVEEQEDIHLGTKAARAIASLDIGQTIVVEHRVIVAVEALEGTDQAIRRAHALAGEGLVIVKMASPHQDRRFDLPVIGSETIAASSCCGVGCLAVEAGSALLLDREALIAAANRAKICLIGIETSGADDV